VKQSRILIVSDRSEFVNSLMRNCQCWSVVPEFTVAGRTDSGELPECLVAVVDGVEALSRLKPGGPLVIAVTDDEPLPVSGDPARRIRQLRRGTGWADTAAALAEALVRMAEAEGRLRESERFIALGHFIADARHGLGNLLTSLLGNSELVLLETEGGLRDEVRGQLETIHSMSQKIYEVLQRLTSLDMEMQVAERQATRETPREPAQAVPTR